MIFTATSGSFLIQGGIGAIGTDTLESLDLDFEQGLDVTLNLVEADVNDTDGTIHLNTSLAGLAGLGIDHITGDAYQGVEITNGLGDIGTETLESLDLDFAQGLDVTLNLVEADVNDTDGTIHLNTSLAGLAGLGIDHITGDAYQGVFIAGGIGNFDNQSVNLATLAGAGFDFASNLDTTIALNVADLAGYSGGLTGWSAATADLANVGIDTISVGTADVSLDDISALISSGLDFAANDNISFIDASVVDGTLMASHDITLDELANLGIDTVDANNLDTTNEIHIVAGGGVHDGMDNSAFETALQAILDKFEGAKDIFAANDTVQLEVGNNDFALADLSHNLQEGIQLLGIDFFTDGGEEILQKPTVIV